MAKYYDGPLQKGDDWGNVQDPVDRKYKPASGLAVQQYIKGVFEKKAGIFYMDPTNNRYLVFADEDTRDAYLVDPTQIHLILASFDAPFNYTATINLLTPTYVSVLTGSSGNNIKFTFSTSNLAGADMNEPVNATYTFTNAGKKVVVTEKYQPGVEVTFNIDKYISDGVTNISLSIVGQNTMAATSVGITYNMVFVSLTDTMDISKNYNNSAGSAILEIPFTATGNGIKVITWVVDGEELPFDRTSDEITTVEASRTKDIDISNFAPGKHSVQFYLTMTVAGEAFKSYILYRNFIVSQTGYFGFNVGLSFTIPRGFPLVDDNAVSIRGLEEYTQWSYRLATYSPQAVSDTQVEVLVDGKNVSSLKTNNNQVYNLAYRPDSAGTKPIIINYKYGLNPAAQAFKGELIVDNTTTTLKEITAGLDISLIAAGKSNDDTNKDTWVSGTYNTTFKGFSWDERSGWNNNHLVIAEGSSISLNYAPLASDVTRTGYTLEIELVNTYSRNDTAVIMDTRNASGVGMLITSTKASVKGSNGTTVETAFKDEEAIRISYVLNSKVGYNKLLAFIYINGICSGAIQYASMENFLSDKAMTFGPTTEAIVLLKSIRGYNRALSSDEILNNYMLYQDSVSDMMSIYANNNIHDQATGKVSMDLVVGKLPVMLITGNVPVLENTTDKNETIYVDIDYINLKDSKKNFTGKGTRMRPQGTSSMSYPKKNFRIYLNYGTLKDNNGAVIESGKYAFTNKAQPVSTFCLKADYAESSSSHNTGIAKLWDKAMQSAVLNDKPVLKTQAQIVATETKYPYDVRTTIDGFPIAMFYRLTPTSEVIFLGKYNFNNDKSTESVFGFTDIPGFDNSKVQCWEILNNGNPLALFQTMDGFDEGWEEAYEGRYPDSSTMVSDLKVFSQWVVGTIHNPAVIYQPTLEVSSEVKGDNEATYKGTLGGKYIANGTYPDNAANRQRKFEREKWDHLDVFKMAAYYCYFSRFGAVDQLVKNAMLTTEGTHATGTKSKWYFINYDNDTVNGLRNDGKLTYAYDINRQTIDTSFTSLTYAYAGHESTLWNNLEADAEFMAIVADIDNALYQAGLSYEEVVKVFETQQSDQWSERIYNLDAEYKYLGPYNEGIANNLYMLQGDRQSHRRYWLSKRFDILDSIYSSGRYRAKVVEMKVGNAPAAIPFTIASGNSNIYYGYGINNVVKGKTPTQIAFGKPITFTTDMAMNIGDPLRIYSGPNLREVNLSNFAKYISTLNISGVYDQYLSTKLMKLVLGKEGVDNQSLTDISGIGFAKNLQYLDIRNYKAITSLDLTSNLYIKELVATNSGLRSLQVPAAAPLVKLQLPATMQSLQLQNISTLPIDQLTIGDQGMNLTTIKFLNCSFDTFKFIQNWMVVRVGDLKSTEVTLTNIHWVNMDVAELINLGRLQDKGATLSLKGKIKVVSANPEDIDELLRLFGPYCLTPQSDLYISAPDAIYITGPEAFTIDDTTYQYVATVFAENYGRIEYVLVSSNNQIFAKDEWRSGLYMDSTTGILKTSEFDHGAIATGQVKVRVNHYPTTGPVAMVDMPVAMYTPKYPTSCSITNPGVLGSIGNYQVYAKLTYTESDQATRGLFTIAWALAENPYVRISSSEGDHCTLSMITVPTSTGVKYTLDMYIRNRKGVDIRTNHTSIVCAMPGIIMTSDTNPSLMKACFRAKFAANSTYMLQEEASTVTALPPAFTTYTDGSNIPVPELKFFDNLTNIMARAFHSISGSIPIPSKVTTIEPTAFIEVSLRDGEPLLVFSEGCQLTYLENPVGVISQEYITEGTVESLNLSSYPKSLTVLRLEPQYSFKMPAGSRPPLELVIPANLTRFGLYLDPSYEIVKIRREVDSSDLHNTPVEISVSLQRLGLVKLKSVTVDVTGNPQGSSMIYYTNAGLYNGGDMDNINITYTSSDTTVITTSIISNGSGDMSPRGVSRYGDTLTLDNVVYSGNFQGHRGKSLTLTNGASIVPLVCTNYFSSCRNLGEFSFRDLRMHGDCSYAFTRAVLPQDLWPTTLSDVTGLAGLCSNITYPLDLEKFPTIHLAYSGETYGRVVSAADMLSGTKITSVPARFLDASELYSDFPANAVRSSLGVDGMFSYCTLLTEVSPTVFGATSDSLRIQWSTAANLFKGCSTLPSLPDGFWDIFLDHKHGGNGVQWLDLHYALSGCLNVTKVSKMTFPTATIDELSKNQRRYVNITGMYENTGVTSVDFLEFLPQVNHISDAGSSETPEGDISVVGQAIFMGSRRILTVTNAILSGRGTFSGCSSMTSITYRSVEVEPSRPVLHSSMFYDTPSLTSIINLPPITALGASFASTTLTSLILRASPQSSRLIIGKEALCQCYSLQDLYIQGTTIIDSAQGAYYAAQGQYMGKDVTGAKTIHIKPGTVLEGQGTDELTNEMFCNYTIVEDV